MAFGLEDPQKQRAFLGVLLALGLGYVFYAYVYGPVHDERVAASERLEEIESYNSQARALSQPRRLNELRRQEAEYQVALAAYETMLPAEAEVAGLLGDVAAGAASNGVTIVNFAPLEAVAGENLTELPYDLQVQGGYHDIGRFLAEIANLPHLVRPSVTAMEQVRIEEEAPEGQDGDREANVRYEVLATMRLATFLPVVRVEAVVDEESEDEEDDGDGALGPGASPSALGEGVRDAS